MLGKKNLKLLSIDILSAHRELTIEDFYAIWDNLKSYCHTVAVAKGLLPAIYKGHIDNYNIHLFSYDNEISNQIFIIESKDEQSITHQLLLNNNKIICKINTTVCKQSDFLNVLRCL